MGSIQFINYDNKQLSELPFQKKKVVFNVPSRKQAKRVNPSRLKLPQHLEKIRKQHHDNKFSSIDRNPAYYIESTKYIYQGSWNKGVPNGQGRVFYSDNSFYEGLFKEGLPDNSLNESKKSLYIFSDGSFYKGGFKEAKFSGQGQLTVENYEIKYQGHFRNGLPHGKGTEKLLHSNKKYKGEFKNGQKSGKGEQFTSNYKLQYSGQFLRGFRHGSGVLYYQDGRQFQGQFEWGRKIQSINQFSTNSQRLGNGQVYQ